MATSIGIFSFSVGGNVQGFFDTTSCQAYGTSDNYFIQGAMWITAQYASLIAPCLALCAMLLTVIEIFFGTFCGSFLIPLLLFLLVFAVQGLTFFAYNESGVCFRTEQSDELIQNSCQLSSGAFLSMSAAFAYYICAVLICCLPRPVSRCTSRASSFGSPTHKRQTISPEESSQHDLEAPTVSGWTRSTASLSQQQ